MVTTHCGSTRFVILIGPIAVKLPRVKQWRLFLRGLLANMQECQFSKTGWPELCPIIFGIYGGFMVVMRRAKPLSDAEWESFSVSRFINTNDYCVPVESKRSSFGVYGGRIVAVDYGD